MELFSCFDKYQTYLVGGAIRNWLLKKEIYDIDIIVVAEKNDFINIIKKISKKFNIFPLDRERGIYRINISKELTIDISMISDLGSDLMARDFTINSLAVDIKKAKVKVVRDSFKIKINKKDIIDKLSGIKDINHSIIRVNSEKSFIDDPLRLLRAYRFFATLDFDIDKQTLNFIGKNKTLIHSSSPERIREELLKIFETDNTEKTFKKMAENEFLFELFPVLKMQMSCAEVYYGKGGVLKHTFNVLKRLDLLYQNPKKYLNISKKLLVQMKNEKALIKLAGLLHDVAKPHKAKFIKDRLRFFGHEEYGGILSERILRDFKFSNNEIRYVKVIISDHLRVGNIAHNNIITPRAILRIFYDLKEYTLGLLILSWADHSSYMSEKKLNLLSKKIKEKPFEIKHKLPKNGPKKTVRFLQVVNMILKNYSRFNRQSDIKPIIDGNEIMQILNIKPSPVVGKIIKKLINLQLEKKLINKKDATNYIKSLHIEDL
jgi:tRNA nucleotidyltransferase/poly(A) polymerase